MVRNTGALLQLRGKPKPAAELLPGLYNPSKVSIPTDQSLNVRAIDLMLEGKMTELLKRHLEQHPELIARRYRLRTLRTRLHQFIRTWILYRNLPRYHSLLGHGFFEVTEEVKFRDLLKVSTKKLITLPWWLGIVLEHCGNVLRIFIYWFANHGFMEFL